MKYAIVESGGKQYVAREGETIEIDRLPVEVGKSITFKEVLLVVDDGTAEVGNPYVKGVSIKGTVLAEVKAPKVIVFKYIPKERYRRTKGHRQRYTRVLINAIGAQSTAKKTETKEAEKESKPAPQKKTAEKPKPAAKKTSTSAAKKPSTKSTAKKPTTKTASTEKAASPSKSKAKTAKTKTSTTKSKSSSTKSTSSEKKSSTKKSTTQKSSTKSSGKSSSSKAKSEK